MPQTGHDALQERAFDGDVEAMGLLGLTQVMDREASEEERRAGRGWLEAAAAKGDLAALLPIGLDLLWSGDPVDHDRAFRIFSDLIEHGHGAAHLGLHICHCRGLGCEADDFLALAHARALELFGFFDEMQKDTLAKAMADLESDLHPMDHQMARDLAASFARRPLGSAEAFLDSV